MEGLAKPPILIISGGVGSSGEQLVHTILAQFPADSVNVITYGNLRQPEQIDDILKQAIDQDGLVVSTLVDSRLNEYTSKEAARLNVSLIDVMGPVIQWISIKLGTKPAGQPGLYRKLHREYFDRVAAIDFAMAHDDGKNPEDWPQAEAILVGVSRVGKTPLSLYLAVLGWKVANYPVVPQISFAPKIFELDPRRIFGLTIDPDQLVQFRIRRLKRLGTFSHSDYTNPHTVYEEVKNALRLFRQSGFNIINMTNKTIELGADEIISHLARID